MVLNGDILGDYFMSSEVINRMFNVLIFYGWFNESTAPVLD